MSLDPEARTAKLQGGEEVAFGKALIGTGAIVNILRVEGAENEGIHYLRAFGNSDAIRADAEAAEHVVLIGGSYIGTEVAASLTAKGVECTIVMMEDVALSRTFGEEAGRWFQEHARVARGRRSTAARSWRPSRATAGSGRCVTKSGLRDRVRHGGRRRRGAGPTRCSPSGPGSRSTNGIVCDSKLQTSVEGIYAAGDCCSYDSVVHGRRLRVEHWDVAMQQGMHAAAQHARRRRRLRRRALLLQRPRRLGEPRVRRAGAGLGRGGLARRPRRGRVLASGT